MALKPNVRRCEWVTAGNALLEIYHDKEWGVPVHDDRVHFEFLTLEGAQAGLSWMTILRMREGYRRAFAGFDPKKVAAFDEKKVKDLLESEDIVRNRLKIVGAVTNAQRFLEVQKEFGTFDKYIWQFVGGQPIYNHRKSIQEIPTESTESRALSADLKKRGFKFVGPIIIYAFMLAVGMVDDHTVGCFRYSK